MKTGVLVIVSLLAMQANTSCFPLFELNPTQDYTVDTSKTMGISLLKPASDRTVKKGETVAVEWTASNVGDDAAIATVYVRSSNGEETVLEGGIRVSASAGTQSYVWDTDSDTASFSGEYTILVRMEAGGETVEDEAPGTITISSSPVFAFTGPTTSQVLLPGDPNDPDDPNSPLTSAKIEISWEGYDLDGDGKAVLYIDPDRHDDDPEHDSGNEVEIYETTLAKTNGEDSLQWYGTDSGNNTVDADTYTLYAVVSDDVYDEELIVARFGNSTIRLTVPDTTTKVEFDEDEDASLVIGDRLRINYTLNENSNVYLYFQVDPDNDSTNGNEVTIRSRTLVERGTRNGAFYWRGKAADGTAVGFDGTGLFKVYMIIDRGVTGTQTVTCENNVFLRDDADQPVISLVAPASDETLTGGVGGSVLIRWLDDVPNDGTAKIRLVIDDDDTPNENVESDDGDPDTESAEQELPSAGFDDLEAGGGGLQATYRYYVSDDLAPGRYWIFAYIDRDGVAPYDDIAIAAGQIVIEDPDTPAP